MAKVVVKQAHQKCEKEVRAIVEDVEAQLVDDYDLRSSWISDNEIEFKRSGGLSGKLCMEPDCVVITLKLGMMLGMYSKKIQSQLEKIMAERLA